MPRFSTGRRLTKTNWLSRVARETPGAPIKPQIRIWDLASFRRRDVSGDAFQKFQFASGAKSLVQRRGKIHGQKFFVAEQGAEPFAQGFDAAGNAPRRI